MKISLQQVAIPTSAAGTTFNITDPSITSDFKGAIFFGGNPTANATTTAGAMWSIGACDAAGRNVCLSACAADATSAATNITYGSNANCFQLLTNTAGLGVGATYSATLANGVTLVTNNNPGGARLLNALMFAGSDIEFAVSSQFFSTASDAITHNLTGTPDCVMVLGSTANAALPGGNPGGASIGFFDGTNSVGFAGTIVSAANPTNVAARCGTANMGEQLSQTPTDDGAWTISAVGASTLTITRSAHTALASDVMIVAWRHLSSSAAGAAFTNTTPSSTGSNVVNTGMTSPPQLWLNVSTRLTSTAFANSDSAGSWGFAAAVNNNGTTQQAAIGGSFQNAVSASSVAKSYNSNATASQTLSDAGAIAFASTVTSFNSDGITESVSTAAAGERINLAYGVTPTNLLGQDGSGWSTTSNDDEFNASGNAASSGAENRFTAQLTTTATTAWINVGVIGTSNTAKVCVYNSAGTLIATSAAINVASAGLRSGAISCALTRGNTYTVVVVPDTGNFNLVYQTGAGGFVDKQWTAAHFSYTSPPSTLPTVDTSIGHEFIVYLTSGGNAYNLSLAEVPYSLTLEAVTLNTTGNNVYVLPLSAVVFDRILGISTDDQILELGQLGFNLSIGAANFHPQGINIQAAELAFAYLVGNTSFSYIPGTGIIPVTGTVPCSFDFSNYPGFRTAVQQFIDGDDASTSSLSVSILDLIISLGERRVYRDVRSSTQDTALSITTTGNSAPLPVDLIELRSVYLGLGKPAIYLPYEAFQERLQLNPIVSTKAWFYTYEGENIVFYPAQPDGTGISGRYYKRFCSIVTEGFTDANGVFNTFFQRYPDLWLYACLVESAPYVGEIARMAEWKERYAILAEAALEYEMRRFTRGSKLQTRPS